MATPSLMSFLLDARRDWSDDPNKSESIITGSGFCVRFNDQNWLITNRHVVTGRTRDGDVIGRASLPQYLTTWILKDDTPPGTVGWFAVRFPLYDNDCRALWLEHPRFGARVDVVAYLLPPLEEYPRRFGHSARFIPYTSERSAERAFLGPTSDVQVVGFPWSHDAGGRTAIWSRGSVASEPCHDYEGEPCFLIDARTQMGIPDLQSSGTGPARS